MRKIIILLIGTFSTSLAQGQAKPPFALEEYYEFGRITPKEDIRLFDLKEINSRKIDTAYIIRHPPSWEENWPNPCSYNDTVELYRFDSKGRIIQWTSFQQGGDYSTTFHLDSLGRTISRVMYSRLGSNPGSKTYLTPPADTTNYKYIFRKLKIGNDSILTQITLWKFKTGFDTAYIVTKIFNARKQLLDLKSVASKKYKIEIFDDGDELTYHYKYGYDDKGRLIYFQAFGSGYYQKISYQFYGRLNELYDVQTNVLMKKWVRLLEENEGIIAITTGGSQIILTPLEKGSKLYRLKSIISSGEFPSIEYYEISYK